MEIIPQNDLPLLNEHLLRTTQTLCFDWQDSNMREGLQFFFSVYTESFAGCQISRVKKFKHIDSMHKIEQLSKVYSGSTPIYVTSREYILIVAFAVHIRLFMHFLV